VIRRAWLVAIVGCGASTRVTPPPQGPPQPPGPGSAVSPWDQVAQGPGVVAGAPGGPAPGPTTTFRPQPIAALIPFQAWPPLPGHAVGIVFASGRQPWGGSIDHLRGVDINPQQQAYMFMADGSSPYAVHWHVKGGGPKVSPGYEVCVSLKPTTTARFDAAYFQPGDRNTYGLHRRAHIVDLEINGGRGSCGGSDFVVTAAKILDGTPDVPFDAEHVLLDLRRMFDERVKEHEAGLHAAMVEDKRVLEREKRERSIGILPSWRTHERELSVLFVLRDLHEGWIGMSRPAQELFAHPMRRPPERIARGAAMAVRYTVDHTGRVVGEELFLPSGFSEGAPGRDDDWYGKGNDDGQ
jgi:hypothetical protein